MEVSPLMSTPSAQQGYVNLNVGGTFFTTSPDTLTRYAGSKLYSMFSTDGIPTVPRDEFGRYFIDRDGSVFGFILNYLRSGNLNLPTDFTAHEQLLDEVDYFQLSDMKKDIATRMESGEKQRLILKSPDTNYDHIRTIYKIQDQFYYLIEVNNVLWRKTDDKLRQKAKLLHEYNLRAEVFSLQCSPTIFQFVIDFCQGKKSFMPKKKDEWKNLITFAEHYELTELVVCLDRKKYIL